MPESGYWLFGGLFTAHGAVVKQGRTREFLDYFGLKSLDDLPTLAELRDLDDIKLQLEFPGGEPVPGIPALPAPLVSDSQEEESATEEDEPESVSEPEQAPTLVAAPSDDERS